MDRPTWLPGTYAAAAADVAGRQVAENHYTELKSTYERTDGGRREMAKDIAALALDGGALIVGINEDEVGRAVEVSPVDLAGFAERLDQAATYRCDPPVQVGIDLLPHPEDPVKGVLVVQVPANPLAPVMVDGRYYGRGERAVRQLGDAEVVRLHQNRAGQADHVERTLTAAVTDAQSGLMPNSGKEGRLVVVAEPAPIRRTDLMADVYGPNNWWRWYEVADARAAQFVQIQDDRSPVLAECLYAGGPFSPFSSYRGSEADRQPRGVMVTIGANTSGGFDGYLQLDESGALRLGVSKFIRWERSTSVLDWHFAISASVYIVGMYQQVCEKSGIQSQLDMGICMDELQGVVPSPPSDRHGRQAWDLVSSYANQSYRATTRLTVPEMTGDLTRAMERVWGPLLRPLGLGDRLRARPGTLRQDVTAPAV